MALFISFVRDVKMQKFSTTHQCNIYMMDWSKWQLLFSLLIERNSDQFSIDSIKIHSLENEKALANRDDSDVGFLPYLHISTVSHMSGYML